MRIAAQAGRRFSGFTCYAALAPHRASNIEDVSYQILLGEKKYFVSTDGGGERQQWFALIREPAGGVDPEPTDEDPTPKLTRLRQEFSCSSGDADGNVWDPFALELIEASAESDIKRRALCGGSPGRTCRGRVHDMSETCPVGATSTMGRPSSPLGTRVAGGRRGQRGRAP